MHVDEKSSDFIGQAVSRRDGPDKVTGRARFTADVVLPDVLIGRCLRSPYPSARIVSIDVSRAREVPGVFAVLTGADVPDTRYGRVCLDIPILAKGVVRFAGEKIAAVAAESAEAAEKALGLIEVEYQELPFVADPKVAMLQDAHRVHDGPPPTVNAKLRSPGDLRMYPPIPNVVSQLITTHGEIADAFSKADRVFEHSFEIPSVHQGYIEPHSCLISVNDAGDVDVWMSNKSPHGARDALAQALSLPKERIRFNPVLIGGDFGGKGGLMDAPLCYHLALRSRRPVKMVMTYFEELTAGNPRHSASITVSTALDQNARILGMKARMIFNTGAYAGFCPVPTIHGYTAFAGAYKVPNCELEVFRVHTNTVPSGHMRSPGGPQITFAVESHIDMIAQSLQIDPCKFRRDNAIAEGDLSPIGEPRKHVHCKATIDAAMKEFDWNRPRKPDIGRGIALYEYPPGTFDFSNVIVSIGADGVAEITVGAPETGTGFHTIVAQLVAQEFKIPIEDVRVAHRDTATSSFERGPSGSRLTTTIHQAIKSAADNFRKELVALETAKSERADGNSSGSDTRSETGDLKSLLAWADGERRIPLICSGQNTPTGRSEITCFAAQLAEVEVDRETGQFWVHRVVSAHDVGQVINPITHQGQIEGGIVQAIGQATCERLHFSDGAVVSGSLGDYKLPTIMDIPDLKTVLVPSTGSDRRMTKSVGEISNTAVIAAVANAIYDAVGVRLIELPLNAETIYAHLQQRGHDQ